MNFLIEEKKSRTCKIQDDNDPQLNMLNAIDGLKQCIEQVVFVRNKGDTSNNVHMLHDK